MSSSPIALNDFAEQWRCTSVDVRGAVERVGSSGWYILGKEVTAFERELAEFCDVDYAVGCASGLDALEIALRASGLQPGDGVMTTPFSAFATTLAIVRAGGAPCFVDVDPNGLLDLDLVERSLSDRVDIRFLLPVHLYGCSLDLPRLREIVDTYDVAIIEDCAQAVGASHRGTLVGTVGRAAGVSFYPTKNLPCLGDGGAVLTNDEAVAESARSLRDYGQSSKYAHDVLGLNSRLDELQAAIMRDAMLPRLREWTARRREIASKYLDAFAHTELRALRVSDEVEPVWHLFPVTLSNSAARDSFISYLDDRGIRTGIHYPFIIPDQKALSELGGSQALSPLDQSRKLAATTVSLPIHPFLTDSELSIVIDACRAWDGSGL